MNIVKGTIQNWTSLDEIKQTFDRKGFTDIKDEDSGFIVTISDEFRELLKVVLVKDDISKYYRFLDVEQGVEYLLLVENFSEFTFVRQKITTLGKKRIEKFKFYRDDPKNSSLIKLNELEFEKVESFENLFDTQAVVKEFYDEYKKMRIKLISKIQGIKEKEDKDKYAQVIFDRLIFLYFIQYKGFLCENKHFLYDKYKEIFVQKKNYFDDFMQFLFFELLNKPNNQRNLKHAEFFDIPFLNGGLFREHRIEIDNPKIWISNDILGEILQFLDSWYWYVDESSDFGEDKALSPEILGHIFEKTVTGQKEKGAYYTPEPITRYISENTVFPYCIDRINEKFSKEYKDIKEILNRKDKEEISYFYFDVLKKISILDNAVGSGAFLLAAQKVLLALYEECWGIIQELNNSEVKSEIKAIEKHKTPEYHFKKWIISHNLYGVDIEEGAIEICKLRLWLSLVSNFTKETIEPLPNIDYNVMCGNSLIGYIEPPKEEQITLNDFRKMSDILKEIHKLKEEFSQEEDPKKVKELKRKIDEFIEKENKKMDDRLFAEFHNNGVNISKSEFEALNIFHWGLKFNDIFSKKGFDIIVGNPPYFSCIKLPNKVIKYFEHKLLNLWAARNDISYYFVLRSLNQLNHNGLISYIMPRYFLKSHYAQNYRNYLKNNITIKEIIDTENYQVFQGVNVLTSIINIKNTPSLNNNQFNFVRVKKWEKNSNLLVEEVKRRIPSLNIEIIHCNQNKLSNDSWEFHNSLESNLIKKIKENSQPLSTFCKIGKGMSTGYNNAYVVSEEIIEKEKLEKEGIRKLLKNGDIRKYNLLETDNSVIYLESQNNLNGLPNIEKHLKRYKNELDKRKYYDGIWFKYSTPRNVGVFNSKNINIVVPFLSTENRFAIDVNKSIPTSGDVHAINLFNQYYHLINIFLGILNSKLIEWYHKKTTQLKREGYVEYNKKQLENFPIKIPEDSFGKLVDNYVQEILLIYKKEKDGELIKNKTQIIINKIDSEVYKLYGLTKDEITIIKESVK